MAMPKAPPFAIYFAEQVEEHLDALETKYHSDIAKAIEEQLRYEPLTPTRNRKELHYPTSYGATWELRCGSNNRFRVLYAVNVESRRVIIVAIGTKIGNRLIVGKEEHDL